MSQYEDRNRCSGTIEANGQAEFGNSFDRMGRTKQDKEDKKREGAEI